MRKKLLIPVVLSVLAISLTACQKSDVPAPTNADTNAATDETTGDNFIPVVESDEFNPSTSSPSGSDDPTGDDDGSFIGKTVYYRGAESSTKSWTIIINYKENWTELTIDHNTQIFATYAAGKKPSGAPQKPAIKYSLGSGSGEPKVKSDNIGMNIKWEGNTLCLYYSDLNSFTPSDDRPWEVDGMKFEKDYEIND